MKKLLLAVMLISATIAFAADFPRDANEVQDYLYTKLGGSVSMTMISTDGIDGKMCMLQYQACKDDRAILRIMTRHIAVACQLIDSTVDRDSQRGLLIANAALKCANLYLKDNILAAGIAISIIQPNIYIAADDFNSDKGRIAIGNEVLDAAKSIDNDDAIIKSFELMITLSKKYPYTVDAYHVLYADYQYKHGRYNEALTQLNAMTIKDMIDGVAKFKTDVENKINKVVK